jgi:hypothetical protein
MALLMAGFAAAAVVLASGKAQAASETVYSNDFATAIGPAWSTQEDETSPDGERFLGGSPTTIRPP